jgi:intracellular multiplication protein IcmO
MDEGDTLRLAGRLANSVSDSAVQTAAVLAGLAAAGCLHPAGALAATACGAALFANRIRRQSHDVLGRSAAEVRAMRAGFSLRLGNETGTGRPIHLSREDLSRNALVLGNTGSGKTDFLLGLAEQAIAAGSGTIFVDGKGDVSLFAKMFAIAGRHGRLDDLLVVNMMTGNANVGSTDGLLLSNSFNPFATGSSDSLTQLLVGLMDEVGGDGAMWKGRATAMFTGIMAALVWLRDKDGLVLDVGSIREHLGLGSLVGLADGSSAPGMPEGIRARLMAYLTSLPNFNLERGAKQPQATLDQHGYLEMQFERILGHLSDIYAHVYRTQYADVDMTDVVLNRRILLVMLPALELSGDELANLGKVVVAGIKAMIGAALGNRIPGDMGKYLDGGATVSESPVLCILDEVGYYAVEGLALMAAQARSVNVSMIFSSQDIPAMRRLNEREAASIIANTGIKIFTKVEEMEFTGALSVQTHGIPIDTRPRPAPEVSELAGFKAGDFLMMIGDRKVRGRSAGYSDATERSSRSRWRLRANYFSSMPSRALSGGAPR